MSSERFQRVVFSPDGEKKRVANVLPKDGEVR
jgi:hypothetical protein